MTTIVTGKKFKKHGIQGYVRKLNSSNKVIPMTSNLRKIKALWNMLTDNDKNSIVVNYYVTYPGNKNIDFVARGEGEITFYKLVEAIDVGESVKDIAGISYRNENGIVHNKKHKYKRHRPFAFPARRLFLSREVY